MQVTIHVKAIPAIFWHHICSNTSTWLISYDPTLRQGITSGLLQPSSAVRAVCCWSRSLLEVKGRPALWLLLAVKRELNSLWTASELRKIAACLPHAFLEISSILSCHLNLWRGIDEPGQQKYPLYETGDYVTLFLLIFWSRMQHKCPHSSASSSHPLESIFKLIQTDPKPWVIRFTVNSMSYLDWRGFHARGQREKHLLLFFPAPCVAKLITRFQNVSL